MSSSSPFIRVGGGVTTAQPLMVIVPEDSRLEVEVFSFTRYGLIPGRHRRPSSVPPLAQRPGGHA
ncbi:hypothetical protein VY88_28990 [Azospirillum thiophilum]|uniref:hypothetical protein n=1 Tax=Azospirillum thiophilum TaxID=528244 RepID=UPI00061E5D7A|nr:hypothetical protein [Azospirillum thiophilum]KJR61958.1 hypothetical protein VY88_27730 [Azospirillum thiophilum]KJR62135.1 hypothetical protein VY88_28990 [Azospirillum thiophilum]